MNIYCPTTAYLPRITTPEMFDETLIFVVHDECDKERLHEEYPDHEILVSGVSRDLPGTFAITEQRNFIFDQLEIGEWCGMVDDDLAGINGPQAVLSQEHHDSESLDFSRYPDTNALSVMAGSAWKEAFSKPTTVAPWCIMEDLREKAEESGTILGGLIGHNNFFFCNKRWSLNGMVIARFIVAKKDGRPWIGCNEDVERTCYALTQYGGTVVDKWFHLVSVDNAPEMGIGTLEMRGPYWKEHMPKMAEVYPGLLKLEYPIAKLVPTTRSRFLKWFRGPDREVALANLHKRLSG